MERKAAQFPAARHQLRRLVAAGNKVREAYQDNPEALLRTLCACMTREAQVLEADTWGEMDAESPPPSALPSQEGYGDLRRAYAELEGSVGGMEDDVRTLQALQEEFRVRYSQNEDAINALVGGEGPPPGPDREALIMLYHELARSSSELLAMRKELTQKVADEARNLRHLQSGLGDVLGAWRERQFRGSGDPVALSSDLDAIRELLVLQAQALVSLQERLEVLAFLESQLPVPEGSEGTEQEQEQGEGGSHDVSIEDVGDGLNALIENLAVGAWVIVDQPPLAVRRKAKIQLTVEFLIGHAFLAKLPTVSVHLLDAETAQPVEASLLNGTRRAETRGGRCLVEYKTLVISELSTSKSDTRISDEIMYRLAVASEVVLGQSTFPIVVVSNPLVVGGTRKIKPLGYATMFWHVSFADSFEAVAAPVAVSWTQLEESLGVWFEDSGKGIGPGELEYFRSKLAGGEPTDPDDEISFEHFAKTDMGKGFPFWTWLYEARAVLESSPTMRSLWSSNLIAGFVPKALVGSALANYPDGSFLLRFADSLIGALSVSYIWDDGRQVVHLQPWTLAQFETISLPDRIRQTDYLTLLYPAFVSRDEAFGSYYSPDEPEQAVAGYVTTGLKMTVAHHPGGDDGEGQDDGHISFDDLGYFAGVSGGGGGGGPSSSLSSQAHRPSLVPLPADALEFQPGGPLSSMLLESPIVGGPGVGSGMEMGPGMGGLPQGPLEPLRYDDPSPSSFLFPSSGFGRPRDMNL